MINLEDLKRYEDAHPDGRITFYKGIPGRFDFQNLYREAVSRLKDGDRAVEVGSLFGASAAFLADACAEAGKKIEIDVVDLWDPAWVSTVHQDPIFFDLCDQAGGFFAAFEFFTAQYKAKLQVHRADSVEVLNKYTDGSLGFVFLDGNHSYEHVLQEISIARTKIRSGGILAGHDFYPEFPPDRPKVNGVAQAVVECFGNRYRLIKGTCGVRSWWVDL